MNRKLISNITIFVLLFLGSILFPYIPIELFHLNLNNLPDNLKILYQFSCDIGFMIIIYTIYHKNINHDFKTYFKNFDKFFSKSIKYYIIGYIIMIISNILISFFFTNATATNEEIVRSLIDKYPLYMFFSVSIYAPFVEEIIYRKCIYDIVYSTKENKYTKYIYIISSGFIFAALHVLDSTSNIADYIYIIPYLSLGIAFAALYEKTHNIFSTITMHSLHNTLAILNYFRGGNQWKQLLNT